MVDLYWPSSKSAIILRSRSCMKGNRAQVHQSEEDRTDTNLLSPSGFASTLVLFQSRNDLRHTVEREREREKRKQDIIEKCTKAAGAKSRGGGGGGGRAPTIAIFEFNVRLDFHPGQGRDCIQKNQALYNHNMYIYIYYV
jgi:hypothetical protein